MFTLTNSELMLEDRQMGTESGMVTAEYAIGTCAAGGFAGVLITLLRSDWIQNLLKAIFEHILGNFLS